MCSNCKLTISSNKILGLEDIGYNWKNLLPPILFMWESQHNNTVKTYLTYLVEEPQFNSKFLHSNKGYRPGRNGRSFKRHHEKG